MRDPLGAGSGGVAALRLMVYNILTFLVGVGVTLVGGACLVRAAMRWRRMSFANPVGQLVLAFSDWLVRPLERIFPAASRADTASLVAAWLLELLQYAMLMTLVGDFRWAPLPVLALLGTVKLAISVATVVVIVAAVLSWTSHRSLITDVLERLSDPLLAPLRRLLPNPRGIDLSPLVAIVVLQVLAIVVGSLQVALLGHQLGLVAAARLTMV